MAGRKARNDQVYETLKEEIIDLRLAPGSPIDEISLTERFEMSRTPVREAMVRLASEGLISMLQGRSSIVSNIDFVNLPQFFDALTLMYRVTTKLAATHRSQADLEAINTCQTRFETAVRTRNALDMISANTNFHLAIAEAGKNGYFTGFFEKVLIEGRRLLRLYYMHFDDELPTEYVREHQEMIAAIEARDPDRAEKLALAHAEQVVGNIRNFFTNREHFEIAI